MGVELDSIAALLRRTSALEGLSDTPRLDLEVLLGSVLNKPRSYLYTWPERRLPPEAVEQFEGLLQRRVKGEPIAYLLGEREFWSLMLEVDEHTLIPRPETELLVEVALALVLPELALPKARVLDLGTGTGAIALALASERPDWDVLAVDRVVGAVALAEKNRQRLGLCNVQIQQSSWFECLAGERFDLIVTNPPYIESDSPYLQQGDVRFEPKSALVAANKGLSDIKQIVSEAGQYMNRHAWLLIEHGFEQGEVVRNCLHAAGFVSVATRKDLAGLERLSLAQFI